MADLAAITTLTFDCYGTLIDWEAGILGVVRPFLDQCRTPPTDDQLLAAFAHFERRIQAGPYLPYRNVLALVMRELTAHFDAPVSAHDFDALAKSLPAWPAFPDTATALRVLAAEYRIGVLSNIDDDLLEGTRRRSGLTYHWAVTAQHVRSYKPAPAHFTAALERHGLSTDQVLHIASSIGHDIAPASALGIRTVHLHRRAGRGGPGANGPGEARPTFEVADFVGLFRLLHITQPAEAA